MSHIAAQTTPAPEFSITDPMQRHLLRQVGIVAREIGARQDRSVQADGDVGAALSGYMALGDAGGGMDMLRAQAAAMHEIAMAALSRAAAQWAKTEDHHRNVWDAVRATTAFMRLLNGIAKEAAALRAVARAAENGEGLARAEHPDTDALARDVMRGMSREAKQVRAGRAKKDDPDAMSDEDIDRRIAFYDEKIAAAGGKPTYASLEERIAALEAENIALQGALKGAQAEAARDGPDG